MPLPWFKRQGEEIPKELEGMETSDLVNAVNAAKEVEGLKTQVAAMQGQSTELETLRTKLAELESRTPPREEPKGQPNQPTSVFDDEDKAIQERIMPYMTAVFRNQALAAKQIAMQSLSKTDAQIWGKYAGEIDEVMKTVDVTWQANPQTWLNALDTVAGRHRNDLTKMAQERTDFFAETANSTGQGMTPQEREITLNADQQKMIRGLGVKQEDYIKTLKETGING